MALQRLAGHGCQRCPRPTALCTMTVSLMGVSVTPLFPLNMEIQWEMTTYARSESHHHRQDTRHPHLCSKENSKVLARVAKQSKKARKPQQRQVAQAALQVWQEVELILQLETLQCTVQLEALVQQWALQLEDLVQQWALQLEALVQQWESRQ